MIYQCKDIYLCSALLTFKGFKLIEILKEENKLIFVIEYQDKDKLLKLIDKFINKNLMVNFEKYKQKLYGIHALLQEETCN
jgi:hypothetical protein